MSDERKPIHDATLHALLGDAAIPPPDADSMNRMRSHLARELAFESSRWPVAVAVALAFVALGLRRASLGAHPRDWGVASTFAVLAMLLTWRVSRARAMLVACLVASCALALVASSGAGALAPLLGVKCALSECVAACLPLATTLYLARRRRAEASPSTLAAVAAAGALAGQAGLHLTCTAHAQSAHVVVFHLLGVALAAGLGRASAALATPRVEAHP